MEKYTFELNENVTRVHVSYKNRYGIPLAADLYTAKGMRRETKHPALVVGPPYGGCKEQSPGVYANELAQRGFVVLAFDPAYNGESGGEPRHISSPEIFAENFSAGVDYLGTRPFVDREKIGAIGICGSGGFAISAAQMDSRIKAVATASMYDISSMRGMFEPEQLRQEIDRISRQRWADFESGEMEYVPSFPEEPVETVPDGLDPAAAEFYSYYGLARGHHPNARGGFTTTSQLAFLNFQLLNIIKKTQLFPKDVHFFLFSTTARAAVSDLAPAEYIHIAKIKFLQKR